MSPARALPCIRLIISIIGICSGICHIISISIISSGNTSIIDVKQQHCQHQDAATPVLVDVASPATPLATSGVQSPRTSCGTGSASSGTHTGKSQGKGGGKVKGKSNAFDANVAAMQGKGCGTSGASQPNNAVAAAGLVPTKGGASPNGNAVANAGDVVMKGKPSSSGQVAMMGKSFGKARVPLLGGDVCTAEDIEIDGTPRVSKRRRLRAMQHR